MGKYQAYPEYKDSGVEWLRKVPTHWKVISLKYCVEKIIDNRGRTPPTTDSGIPLLEAKQMGGESIYSQNNFDKYISEEAYSAFIRDDVIENDILFVTVGTVGKTNLVPKDAKYVIAQNIVGLRVRSYMNPLYFLFYLRSNEIKAEMSATNKDSILDSIKISDFIQSNICIPDLIEQQKIANFLDHEIAKIDTLIEQQQQLIQLLKEKRQAVISHAVTKGLSSLNGGPYTPMKDSGVEWLGEVPANWEASQLKYKVKSGTSITYGIVQAGPHVEDGIPYIKTSDMSGDKLPIDGYSKTSHAIDNSYSRSKVYEGDIVIAIRASVGKCLIVPKEISGANLTQGTAKISPSGEICSDYLLAYLSSEPVQLHLNTIAKGATFKEITLDMLRRVPVLVPPIEEQKNIMLKVQSLMERFTSLISNAELQMYLLSERRTALISAAVTGKIDVRNWQAPNN